MDKKTQEIMINFEKELSLKEAMLKDLEKLRQDKEKLIKKQNDEFVYETVIGPEKGLRKYLELKAKLDYNNFLDTSEKKLNIEKKKINQDLDKKIMKQKLSDSIMINTVKNTKSRSH